MTVQLQSAAAQAEAGVTVQDEMLDYAVDEAWEANLEPGWWYRIVDAQCPRIICGFVFIPRRGETDYREVDGKKLSPRAGWYEKVTAAWRDTVEKYEAGRAAARR